MRARGFTLVEAMVATALGLVVLVTAWAAVRVTAQTATAADRLATTNALIRAGWFAAMDEADGWAAVDDPVEPSRRALRAWNGRRGAPFAPFPATWPRDGTAGAEDEVGWDPDCAWDASDERTWFHGNIAEQYRSDHRFGRYELFGHRRAALALTGYGAAASTHPWLANQTEDLRDRLGYYGAIAYMPANAIWAVYGSGERDAARGDDGWQREWLELSASSEFSAPAWRFTINEGDSLRPRGIYGKSNNAAFGLAVAAPGGELAGASPAALIAASAGWLPVGQYAGTGDVARFLGRCLARSPLTPTRPAAWPAVEVAVARMVAWRRPVTSCRVRWRDALSGEAGELSFTVLSTTLRGARQQRRLADDPSSPAYDIDLDGGRHSTRCAVREDQW